MIKREYSTPVSSTLDVVCHSAALLKLWNWQRSAYYSGTDRSEGFPGTVRGRKKEKNVYRGDQEEEGDRKDCRG